MHPHQLPPMAFEAAMHTTHQVLTILAARAGRGAQQAARAPQASSCGQRSGAASAAGGRDVAPQPAPELPLPALPPATSAGSAARQRNLDLRRAHALQHAKRQGEQSRAQALTRLWERVVACTKQHREGQVCVYVCV